MTRPHLTLVRPDTTLDDAELADLYRRHGSALYRYLLTRTFGDSHLAEDILQETFLRAWRTPEVLKDTPACRAWLTTVARNLVVDRLRKRRCRPQEAGDEALPHIPAELCEMDRVVTSVTVRTAMARLTPLRREILTQMYLHDRSLKDVAETLGIPVGTVKSRAHAALRALQCELTGAAALCAA